MQPGFTAVDRVSFDVAPGEVVGIVGESGSGKSVTSMAVMGLLPPRGVAVTGQALYRGRDLLTLPDRERARYRGAELAMVFQDPMTSLNPYLKVSEQLVEVLEHVDRDPPQENAHGGAGETLDTRALCLIRETLARHSGLADFAFAMQGLGTGSITLFGSEELKRHLPQGERGRAASSRRALSRSWSSGSSGDMVIPLGRGEAIAQQSHGPLVALVDRRDGQLQDFREVLQRLRLLLQQRACLSARRFLRRLCTDE